MTQLIKLKEEKSELEKQLKELNFKCINEPQNKRQYIIPIQIFKLKRSIKIKEIDIENLTIKIEKLKKQQNPSNL